MEVSISHRICHEVHFNDFTKPRSVNSILQIQKPDEPTALIRLYLWQFEYLILAAQSMYFWRILECIMLLSKIAEKPILTGFYANWVGQKSAKTLVFMRVFGFFVLFKSSLVPSKKYDTTKVLIWVELLFLLVSLFL